MTARRFTPIEWFARLDKRVTRPTPTKQRQLAIAALAGEHAREGWWQNELVQFRCETPMVRYRGRDYYAMFRVNLIHLCRYDGRLVTTTKVPPYSYCGFVEAVRAGKISAPASCAWSGLVR